jgi:hypothetical protein
MKIEDMTLLMLFLNKINQLQLKELKEHKVKFPKLKTL